MSSAITREINESYIQSSGQAPISLIDFLLVFQIQWKLNFAAIQLFAVRSQENYFAHAMTAQLSCHVQNYVVITLLEVR